jgi:SAM-dependent methyltransferase
MTGTQMLTLLDEDRHWWFASRTRAILAYLDRHVGPNNSRRVLDVGCGAGNMAHHLRHYGQVMGLDNNPRPLAVARERGLEAHEGLADNLPFPDADFGLVALLDTVEHVADDELVFAECRRVLSSADPYSGTPGGKLLVTVPAHMFLWSNNDTLNRHQRRYTAEELSGKLERAGFNVLAISYTNFFVFPLAAALILARRDRSEPALSSPHVDEEAYQVEMEPAPPLVNRILMWVGKLEAALLRRVSLPVGTSLIAVAEKKGR